MKSAPTTVNKENVIVKIEHHQGKHVKLQAVLFDMDGVLLDSAIPSFELIKNTLQAKGAGTDISLHELADTYNGKHSNDIYEALIDRYGLGQTVEEFRADHRRISGNFYTDAKLYPMEGLVPFLEFIKSNRVVMATVSSTNSKSVLFALNRLSLVQYFSAIVCGDHVVHHKPAPEGYFAAASLLAVKPEHCLVVEDSALGILAAKNAGMTVAGYKGSAYVQDTSGADKEVFSFDELLSWVKISENFYL